ncbi:MAG: HAMP domain-containing histidine kinase [Actinobacteria bacterium]|nr:HAMP domain-containing histidine kinase [Actinomycetota bacterium]
MGSRLQAQCLINPGENSWNRIIKKILSSEIMKIQERVTTTIAITLFIIIFIASIAFTQLFEINNRNTQLIELSRQNSQIAASFEKDFKKPQEAFEYLKSSDYLSKIENITGAKLIIADEDMKIFVNPINIEEDDLKELVLTSRQISNFFTLSDFFNVPSTENSGKLIYTRVGDTNYYVSILNFYIGSEKFFSIFFKPQSLIQIPPVRYIFNLILIFLIASLISIITGVILAKSISGPVLKLNRSVSRISDGDYSEEIRSDTSDEIGILAKNINLMKNKIERSQQSLKEFTYMLSHEIKNMITSINGYAVGISDGVYSTEEEIKEALEIIKNKTGDIENITESLLMLSKIENRLIELAKEKIDIIAIVDELLKLYEKELKRNSLSIKKSYMLPDNLILLSDRYLVQTVISNLINNAIKYSSAKSEIAINISSDNKDVIFSVSNRGYGITDDEKNKIFNMFYRSKKYDFKNIKGFGLGLAISQRISSILGASLDFISKKEVNTFTFRIPVKSK